MKYVWQTMSWHTLSLAALIFVCTTGAQAQQMPEPDGEAIDATEVKGDTQQVQEQYQIRLPGGATETRTRARQVIIQKPSYRSPTLQGEFRAEWMFIIQQGQLVEFWGARIVSLKPTSSLHDLGVRAGDVITRLDGIPIWNRMHRTGNGPWQIVELERHYGATEVRYIRQGSHRVRVGQIVLDTPDFVDEDDNISPLAP